MRILERIYYYWALKKVTFLRQLKQDRMLVINDPIFFYYFYDIWCNCWLFENNQSSSFNIKHFVKWTTIVAEKDSILSLRDFLGLYAKLLNNLCSFQFWISHGRSTKWDDGVIDLWEKVSWNKRYILQMYRIY